MPTRVREDTEDLYTWSSIEETFENVADYEFVTRRVTVFDDGTVRDDAFDEVLRSRVLRDNPPDGPGVYLWNTITFEYDVTGAETRRTVEYDDGVTEFFSFTDGIRSLFQQFDGNPSDVLQGQADAGARDWSSIFTEYDQASGLISYRGTKYDDGVVNYEYFTNGVRTVVDQYDGDPRDVDTDRAGPGARIWSSITTQYDQSTGAAATRETVYDNGLVQLESFSGADLSELVLYDGDPGELAAGTAGPGQKLWTSISSTYGAAGLERREIVHDNGLQSVDTFTFGRLTRAELYDGDPDAIREGLADPGGRDWTSIITDFVPNLDEPGRISRKVILYDDGTKRSEDYETVVVSGEDAVQRTVNLKDTASVVHDWQTLTTVFIADQIQQRVTEFDTGLTRVETFSSGRLESIFDTAPVFDASAPTACSFSGNPDCQSQPLPDPGLFDFLERETHLDESGAVSLRRVLLENGDQRAALFQNGVMREQHIVDGDGDQAWVAQKVLYDADGRAYDTIEFYSEDDVPGDFIQIPASVPDPGDVTGGASVPSVDDFTNGGGGGGGSVPSQDDFANGGGGGGGSAPTQDDFANGGSSGGGNAPTQDDFSDGGGGSVPAVGDFAPIGGSDSTQNRVASSDALDEAPSVFDFV
ncbi:MAG: hypothetical protein ACFB03_21355 [Paracoccaceae bacterium]